MMSLIGTCGRIVARSQHRAPACVSYTSRRRQSSQRSKTFGALPWSSLTVNFRKSIAKDGDALVKGLSDLWHRRLGHGTRQDARDAQDAAVVLMTPGLAKFATDAAFATSLAQVLAPSQEDGTFELVSAIVDEVPSIGKATLSEYEGISILRASAKSLLNSPNLSAPHSRHDPDAVGAMTLRLGDFSTITVPLARTTFHNGKPSSLAASRFNISRNSSPTLTESREPFEQCIHIPVGRERPQPHVQLPLRPVTLPATVTESFGNILRRVSRSSVTKESVPASAELEEAIGNIQDAIAQRLPGMRKPFSVWAAIKPHRADIDEKHRRLWRVDQDLHRPEGPLSDDILSDTLCHGGRIFRLLSGGGGWGDKAGLLSLDPDTSHFPPSEEESLKNLFGSGGSSDFAPADSLVQFFIHKRWLDEKEEGHLKAADDSVSSKFAFGVSEDSPEDGSDADDGDVFFRPGLFGAVSDEAIYVSQQGFDDLKLNVPGTRFGVI